MSAAEERHYRWRVSIPGQIPVVLKFVGGVSRIELAMLYRNATIEPVEGSAVEDRDDDNEGDDHAPA